MFNYAAHKNRIAAEENSKGISGIKSKRPNTKKYPKSSKLYSAPNYPYQNNDIVNCILRYDIDSQDVERVYKNLKQKEGKKKKLKGKVGSDVEIGRPLTFSKTSRQIRRSSLKRPMSAMSTTRSKQTTRKEAVHIEDKTVDILAQEEEKENIHKNNSPTLKQRDVDADDYLGLMNSLIGNTYGSQSKETKKKALESPPTPNTRKMKRKKEFMNKSASLRISHLVDDEDILEQAAENGDESIMMDHIRHSMHNQKHKPPVEKPAWRQHTPGKYQNDGTFSWNDPRVKNYHKKMVEENEKMARQERKEKDALEFVKKKRRVKQQRERFKMQRQRNFLKSQHEPRVRAQVLTFVLGDKKARSSRPQSARVAKKIEPRKRPSSARPSSARPIVSTIKRPASAMKRPSSAMKRPLSARPSSSKRRPLSARRHEELECEQDWSSPEKAMNDIYSFTTKISMQREDERKWTGSDTLDPA
mmetsp:Transcript_6179/g.8987  ORF Transcript_6179/g.8987 Transcript_6179/m.8987 type:complete len:472 (+) Transcript_6179:155-1570(+)